MLPGPPKPAGHAAAEGPPARGLHSPAGPPTPSGKAYLQNIIHVQVADAVAVGLHAAG